MGSGRGYLKITSIFTLSVRGLKRKSLYLLSDFGYFSLNGMKIYMFSINGVLWTWQWSDCNLWQDQAFKRIKNEFNTKIYSTIDRYFKLTKIGITKPLIRSYSNLKFIYQIEFTHFAKKLSHFNINNIGPKPRPLLKHYFYTLATCCYRV